MTNPDPRAADNGTPTPSMAREYLPGHGLERDRLESAMRHRLMSAEQGVEPCAAADRGLALARPPAAERDVIRTNRRHYR